MRSELPMQSPVVFPILIDNAEAYALCVERGFEPLIDERFTLPINLRVDIQRRVFGHVTHGRGNIPQANERFYRWVWEHKPHICEETMRPLREYSSVYCSHILSRGAHPEMAHDPRNINLLCPEMHAKWENGNKRSMRIWAKNKKTIEKLKAEYDSYED